MRMVAAPSNTRTLTDMRRSILQKLTGSQQAESVTWYVCQAIAECLIMCTPFSKLVGTRLIVPLYSLPRASAAGIPHRSEDIRHPCAQSPSQRHSNRALCNDLVLGGVGNILFVAAKDVLHAF
jgi:hypothetical protein